VTDGGIKSRHNLGRKNGSNSGHIRDYRAV